MKVFSSMFQKREIQNSIKITANRFPFPLFISIGVTFLSFALIAINMGEVSSDIITRLILTGIVTFFLSTGVTLLVESLKIKTLYIYSYQVGAFIFGMS